MEKNVGGYDRLARFVVGPVLIVLGIASIGGLVSIAAGTLGVALAAAAVLVGTVLTVTATTQKCPLNSLVGINTHRSLSTRQSSPDEGKPSTK